MKPGLEPACSYIFIHEYEIRDVRMVVQNKVQVCTWVWLKCN